MQTLIHRNDLFNYDSYYKDTYIYNNYKTNITNYEVVKYSNYLI